MTAPARLLALRLQGFKSFGERTLVEFGPGISAVVGPNGSGKSNLADALRWALGEQGKALRLRKSEDVIFAGSEKRSALGMADVTLVFGNADRLLPIDYETVELGRRLFRSGENDYLLNKQRVRLKDLVDLLDAAHLADNAFLFIGQGMVDQALALRPEERRPLFEEVAGVRRHERRKAKAEDQLTEAEANLARVEDVLAELRPQARRLAAQAEQQASRQTAGVEYGGAIIALARSRWQEAAGRAASRRAAAAVPDGARRTPRLAILREAEARAATIARDLASRSETEAERRAAHEAARGLLTELQLRDARAASEACRCAARPGQAGGGTGRGRSEPRGPAAGACGAGAGSRPGSCRFGGRGGSGAGRGARGAWRDAGGEAGRRVRRSRPCGGSRRRGRPNLRPPGGGWARRRRSATEERAAADEAARRLAEAEAACAGPRAAAVAAAEAEKRRQWLLGRPRGRSWRPPKARDRRPRNGRDRRASKAASLRGRHEAISARLAEEEGRGIARAAKRLGGKPLAEGLEVEAGFRVAVEAALGEAMRGYIVGREGALGLDGQRGTLVIETGDAGGGGSSAATAGRASERASERAATEAGEAVIAAAAGHGGGKLGDAIRVDPNGAASRLLARAVWLPDLNSALAVQPRLPAGWIAVTRDGAVATSAGLVSMGRSESLLDRRAEMERLGEEVARLEADAAAAAAEAAAATKTAAAARAALEGARESERRTGAARRETEDAERRATRALENVAREAAWRSAQAARAEADRDRLEEAVRQAEAAQRQAGGRGCRTGRGRTLARR